MLTLKNISILVFLFIFNLNFSQSISGVVLDGVTEEPLEGASVFFDKTSIGTTTNAQGEFTIGYKPNLQTPLIISFIGYQTSISNKSFFESRSKFYLYESSIVLNEITVDPYDNWSKELKLTEFKKHFLGETSNGRSCKILNEEDIILKYNKNLKKLTAKAKGPIYIKNENLKYLISVELQHFEVNYSHVSKNKKHLNLNYVYYAGINYFQSLQKEPSSIIQNIRKTTYLGSSLHFMRALANKQLEKEGFSIFVNNNKVDPKKYISIFPFGNQQSVKVNLKQKLFIEYKNGKESSIESLVKMFYIDNFGNYSPVEKVRFGGEMGRQRMGETLPLDFILETKK